MTSKIKVDNINKVSDDSNIIKKCGTTITLGASGDSIALASGASQTGFGRTGTVDWQTTPKTATFTAVSGEGYFCNTSGGAFTVNLPAGVAGAIVSVADYAATFQTNSVTVTPNGTDKIGSLNENATLNVEGQSVTFVFVDSTQGWINTMDSTSNVRGRPPFICASVSGACNTLSTAPDCANMKIATFTGPGDFTVNAVASCAANNVVSYMVIAGGGSGGPANQSAGGGAGGFREYKSPVDSYTASPLNGNPGGTAVTVTAAAFPIVIGAGGTGSGCGNNGSVSTFSTITSAGGGKGGKSGGPAGSATGSATGGSGGGGGENRNGSAGNTPPTTPPQGSTGGNSAGSAGAGGGGATGTGGNAPPGMGPGGPGGTGATTSINGTPTERAGGGGGGGYTGTPGGPATGGGGAGGNHPGNKGVNGTANTGGGAGGSSHPVSPSCAAQGGSGIVIIRYKFQ